MSGGSSANNSWTILTPEESVAETLRPLAEATEHHEENLISAAGSGANPPAEGQEHLVSEEKTAEQSGDTSTEQHTSLPSGVTDATLPTSLEVSSGFVPGSDALSQSEGLPKGLAQSSPDPDSFSDSYSHITPSPDEPPASILNTETLGGLESLQEEERFTHEGTFHPLDGEEHQQEGEQSDQSPKTTDLGNQAVDSEVGEEQAERTPEEGQPEVRRRRSLLAALERIGKADDEEEVEEEFQLPQREEDSGFSVNKCILGAVILLGLGTIFFSESDYGARELKDSEVPGQQEWLNPEVPPPAADVDNTEFLDKLAKGNQQISVLEAQLQAQREELKVANGHAEAKEQLQWEEVEKENSRLKTEMASLLVLQKENERMKRELESVPALQKELETLRSTLNELKRSAAATEVPVKLTTSPPSGHSVDNRQNATRPADRQARKRWEDQRKTEQKEKHDIRGKQSLKEREKIEHKKVEQKERKDEGKRGKHEQGNFDKEKGKQKRQDHETKQWKEKDWKEDKSSRGDQGKPWRAREGKKEWIEKSEREDWKEEKDWKKARERNVKVNEGKQWRSKEKKDWKGGKDHGEKHRGKDEWEGEEVWKKGKDGFRGSGNEKKDLKEKGEKKEWKKGGEWRGKNVRDESNDWKGKGERKQWDGSENHNKNLWKEREGKGERKEWKSKNGKDDKEWKRKDERKQGNEDGWKRKDDNEWKRKKEKKQWENKKEEWVKGQKRDNRDWKKDRSVTPKHQDEHKLSGNHHHDHHEKLEWGDEKVPHTHRRPALDQPEYWDQQRDRLQRKSKPPQHCNSLETCAQAEKLLPVPFPEFDAVLQTYLGKAEEVGVDAFKRGELTKLATEFFKDGLFVHDQMSFRDFVEDVADILEDMVEGDENEEEEEDSGIEEEMEKFEEEVMKKFSVPGVGEKEERIKGEGRKESGRGRG